MHVMANCSRPTATKTRIDPVARLDIPRRRPTAGVPSLDEIDETPMTRAEIQALVERWIAATIPLTHGDAAQHDTREYAMQPSAEIDHD